MFIVKNKPKSIEAESYRTLRTNIQYSSFDKKHQIILVTSSEAGEGKSTTAGNLALSLAQEGKNVVLIDCDLRRPSLHKKFKVSNNVGLSDVMVGQKELVEVLHKFDNNLTIMTSGKIPPNPSEMLSSNAMDKLLELLRGNVDYVILDTPPVQAVTDAQVLSTKADATLLVVRAGRTKKESVQNAVGLLKKVNANIIGTVLNGVENMRDKYYYYYG